MNNEGKAEELYDLINKAYKPNFYPTREEKDRALFMLQNQFAKIPETKHEKFKEYVVQKAKMIAMIHGDIKSKVNTLVENKFWNQNYEVGVKANKFIEE